jgi:GTP-binding protein
VVATKADKIPKSRWQKHAKQMKEGLLMRKTDTFVMFSSETGLGKDDLWAQIASEAGLGPAENMEPIPKETEE